MKRILVSAFLLVFAMTLSHLAAAQANSNSPGDQLLQAAKDDNAATVRQLLGEGVNIESSDSKRYTALIKAALYGKIEVVNLLLEKGANIEAKNSVGATPLIAAAFWDNLDVVKLLLE